MKNERFSPIRAGLHVLHGALIGLGAVLPGISGGVLMVVFGVYKTIMEFFADPFRKFKSHFPKLFPYGVGLIIGFLGVANLLSFLLDKYPDPSVCVFVGLITGMLPSLFREAGKEGRSGASFVSMGIAMVFIFALLITLRIMSVQIEPSLIWYLFCGFCLALSVIAPGMSFSTLLMPLGLYEPFVAGLGHLDMSVCIPGGIGALVTVILFSKAVNSLFDHHYSAAFHAIIGVVIAATIMIIPVGGFTGSAAAAIVNVICLAAGIAAALALDKFNQKFDVE